MFTNYSPFTEDRLAVGTSSNPAIASRGSSALKSTYFAVIKNALAKASIQPHLRARLPERLDSSFVMM